MPSLTLLTLLVREKFFSTNTLYADVEDPSSSRDPRQRALDLRVESAEASLEAARLYCRITHLETTAAKLLYSSLRRQEQADAATARGQRFFDSMKQDEAALSKNANLQGTLGPEISRKREKAMKMSAEASSHEKKKAEAEERARNVLAESVTLRKERDRRMIEAKRLEAEAVRIESMF